MNYYNDNDKFCVKWLKALIAERLIPQGEVDDRSIKEIYPNDLKSFDQCHFFAGIGGWSHALRLADWPEDRQVWTGSCPCQPFSSAGKGKGIDDKRHLWPAFRWLIAQCRPSVVIGEQVAAKGGRVWLAGVRNDLEALGYAVGAADLPAASVGAPHKRNRLFWVGHTSDQGLQERGSNRQIQQEAVETSEREAIISRSNSTFWHNSHFIQCADGKARRVPGRVADATNSRRQPQSCEKPEGIQPKMDRSSEQRERSCNNSAITPEREWEIEPTLFPLADGLPGRVGLLRGAGNAIIPQVAATFIKAYMERAND